VNGGTAPAVQQAVDPKTGKPVEKDKVVKKPGEKPKEEQNAVIASASTSGGRCLPPEFDAGVSTGVLLPGETRSIQITFKSAQPQKFNEYLNVTVTDENEIMGVIQTHNVLVVAEAYEATVETTFSPKADGLDFGEMRAVCDNG
jgi:hypothetical protein